MHRSSLRFSPAALLIMLGVVTSLLYGIILHVSRSFAFEIPQAERPLLLVLGLFTATFAGYLMAIWLALRVPRPDTARIVLGFAVLFRLLLVGSEPIQEIDIYRYVWDGMVAIHGVSPFAFTPAEVLRAESHGDQPLAQLASLRDSSPAVRALLERIHFGDLPTVYPPVSQAVFAAAAGSPPIRAATPLRILVMKCWLLLFDLGTVLLVGKILRDLAMHPGWTVAYAWCPLVLKEFANSGHLDSIAVCLSTAAIAAALRTLFNPTKAATSSHRDLGWSLLAVFLLALAVGAKLYPVVLVPLLAATAWVRLGAGKTVLLGSLWLVITAAVLFPFWNRSPRAPVFSEPKTVGNSPAAWESLDELDPPTSDPLPPNPSTAGPSKTELPPSEAAPARPWTYQPGDTTAGLKAFFSIWMMNDFIFLNVIENLTADSLRGTLSTPWFVFTSNSFRQRLTTETAAATGLPEARVPFALARGITALIFLGLSLRWAVLAANSKDAKLWLEMVFLTLAWFWLLLPTLNPWYWVWTLPWIAFSRNRSWLLLSGLLFTYYLRFYFAAHFSDQRVIAHLPYEGVVFFDYVVVWLEYVPWFACLMITSRSDSRVHNDDPSSTPVRTNETAGGKGR